MTTETSPLLPKTDSLGGSDALKGSRFSPYRRVLVASLFLSISFVFVSMSAVAQGDVCYRGTRGTKLNFLSRPRFRCKTATPLLFSYRTFTCDAYYDDHPPYEGSGDKCAIKEVETRTAASISLMIAISTVSLPAPSFPRSRADLSSLLQLAGVLNLFVTTWEIRHWGVRSALVQQTFWPCLRNLTQIFASE